MSTITPKRGKNRCTLCHRYKHIALSEQAKRKAPCGTLDCEYIDAIQRELEKVPITEKPVVPVAIRERQPRRLNIKKK